jgi:hypothetical protein
MWTPSRVGGRLRHRNSAPTGFCVSYSALVTCLARAEAAQRWIRKWEMNLKTVRISVAPVLIFCPLIMWIAAQMKGLTLDRFEFTSTVISFVFGAVYLNKFVREQMDS